jgi:hypothetical protein
VFDFTSFNRAVFYELVYQLGIDNKRGSEQSEHKQAAVQPQSVAAKL